MRMTLFLALLLLPPCLVGCTSQRPLSAIVYDSLQNREKIVHPSDEPMPQPTPSYDTYQREREKILSEEKEKQP